MRSPAEEKLKSGRRSSSFKKCMWKKEMGFKKGFFCISKAAWEGRFVIISKFKIGDSIGMGELVGF